MFSPTGTAVIQQSHVARLGYPKRHTSLSPTPQTRKRARRSVSGSDMVQEAPPSHPEGHPPNHREEDPLSEPEDIDSDNDDEETGSSRRYPRDENNLRERGLQPVWTSWGGYPSDAIPDDIKQFLDNGYGDICQFIGSLQSLLWLAGCDELVSAIDDPAYVLEDDVEIVLNGASILSVIERHAEQGEIPEKSLLRLSGLSWPFTTTAPPSYRQVPSHVSECMASHQLANLFPYFYQSSLPSAIRSVRLKRDKNLGRLEMKTRSVTGFGLDQSGLWFRALSLDALISTMMFFIPQLTSQNRENEFGPGFYTTNALHFALAYLRGGGAIMVFKEPDMRNLQVWRPTEEHWNEMMAFWHRIPLSIASNPAPAQRQSAAFIQGPISEGTSMAVRQHRLPSRSEIDQLVAVSYQGCEALSKSLDSIIFIET